MSIPTDELRTHLARELDELGPGPDLVPAAAARGATALRRRRTVAGAALAVGAVAAGTLATAVLQPGDAPSGARACSWRPTPRPRIRGTRLPTGT
jgi:hypothetical protein